MLLYVSYTTIACYMYVVVLLSNGQSSCAHSKPGNGAYTSKNPSVWWPLHWVSIKIQKKKTVTKKVHIFTDMDC